MSCGARSPSTNRSSMSAFEIPRSRAAAAALVYVLACGSGSRERARAGAGASGPTGSGSLTSGAGGAIDPIGVGGGTIGSGGARPGACQEHMVTWTPKTPTVFVLVDRSGSMFTPLPETGQNAWKPLKDAVLQIIRSKQAEVRFGFGAFTGEVGQTCPMFDQVAASLDNYDAIAAVY